MKKKIAVLCMVCLFSSVVLAEPIGYDQFLTQFPELKAAEFNRYQELAAIFPDFTPVQIVAMMDKAAYTQESESIPSDKVDSGGDKKTKEKRSFLIRRKKAKKKSRQKRSLTGYRSLKESITTRKRTSFGPKSADDLPAKTSFSDNQEPKTRILGQN